MITDCHAKYFAHELSKRHSVADAEKLAGTLFDAQVDLNPHQVEAALKDLDEQIKALKKEICQTGNLPDKLALQKKMRPLEQKRDEAWRAYDAAAKEIEVQKDKLLDQVEARLGQQVNEEELFTIRFEIR